MHMDIVEIRSFYHSVLGQMATRSIGLALSRIWQPLPNERLLGLGYARPWLDRFEPDTERTLSFMLAAQGAVKWPREGASRSALVFDEELPLPDSAIDRILMVHALEHAENPRETLMEAWRVLAPNGRLVLVVPNRRGIWARFEYTPFGTGRPFSKAQLVKLLREANFTPGPMTEALLFPPARRPSLLRLSAQAERIGFRLWPVFAGVIVMEAQKRLYQGLPVAERQSRRVFVPVLAPQGSAQRPHANRTGHP
ncbi:class I SAM-dependent methyltransferase [Oricola sp.]|uniref:class I SAM-dependent methyltransferase n=1 Tax=Oricola sp. TaxID=1979950 RepID=UPI003BAC1E7A